MTILLFLLPTLVLVAALLPLLASLRALRGEVLALRGEFGHIRALRPALVDTRDEAAAVRLRLARRPTTAP